jgi:hypothetical protein
MEESLCLEDMEARRISETPVIQLNSLLHHPKSKQAYSSLLLAFSSMVILGVEPHRDP